jgi:hypothetical protein
MKVINPSHHGQFDKFFNPDIQTVEFLVYKNFFKEKNSLQLLLLTYTEV